MFFRDVKPKEGATVEVVLADVHLPVKLGHRDAPKLFAEPLKAQLAVAALGTVLDCRRRTWANGVVKGVDLLLGLRDPSQDGLLSVACMLNALAAPCGSSIRLADGIGSPIPFGRTEGLELSIGSDVTPDAEARRDLAMTCKDAIEQIGVSRGWDTSQDRTLFYFYGENFEEMKARLSQTLIEHPQYGDARLKRVA